MQLHYSQLINSVRCTYQYCGFKSNFIRYLLIATTFNMCLHTRTHNLIFKHRISLMNFRIKIDLCLITCIINIDNRHLWFSMAFQLSNNWIIKFTWNVRLRNHLSQYFQCHHNNKEISCIYRNVFHLILCSISVRTLSSVILLWFSERFWMEPFINIVFKWISALIEIILVIVLVIFYIHCEWHH